MYLAKAYRSIKKSIAKSRTGKPAIVTLKKQLKCSIVHVGRTYMCAAIYYLEQTPFSSIFSRIFQRLKSYANKQDFENELNLTCQAQSTPKTMGVLAKVFCTSGPNLVVLAWMGDELSHRQAQNVVNFDFDCKGESLCKTIGILTKVFYTYDSN